MQFLWPSLLWSLWLVPVLLTIYVWLQLRRRRFPLRYSSLSFVKVSHTRVSRWRRHLPAALFLRALTGMLVALARPQSVVIVAEPSQTIILTIDVSGSMRATDIQPNRIEAAKAAARTFVQGANTISPRTPRLWWGFMRS